MQIRERIEKPFQKRKGEIILFALAVVVITAFMGAKQIVTTSSTVGDRELPIYCVETEEKKIALTFDAAWGNEDTKQIMDILEKHGVKVTFFMTGGWVESFPDDVKLILSKGHDLGNHSENHKNMSQLSDAENETELMKVHEKVKELTGYEMFLFRPPYGETRVRKSAIPNILNDKLCLKYRQLVFFFFYNNNIFMQINGFYEMRKYRKEKRYFDVFKEEEIMVIQHNLLALNANRQLGIVKSNLSKSTEKLSSGYKINRAADDAAGLSISEKMRKQIRGLSQAAENIQDGISLCQVADGALTEVHNMLQRMNELSVQAANGTNSNSDREAIDNEFQQLLTEIDRIGNTTKFNEMKVFEGDDGSSIAVNGGLSGSGAASKYEYITYEPADLVSGEEIIDFNGQACYTESDYGSYSFGFKEVSNATKFENSILSLHLPKEATYVMITFRISGEKAYLDMRQTDLDDTPSALGGLDYLHMSRDNVPTAQLTLASGTCTINNDGSYKLDFGDFGYVVIGYRKGEDLSTAINKNAVVLNFKSKSQPGNIINYDKYIQPVSTNGNGNTGTIPYSDNSLLWGRKWWIQSGADAGVGMFVHTGKLNRRVLKLEGVAISTDQNATKAIDFISNAIKIISAQRSMIGAEQNRLEHAYNINQNTVENTQFAESQIRDTDMASEMVKHSNNTILSQAGQSMLAQANQSNQGILSLIA